MIALELSILGSFIMLDKYAFGEFGISQPIMVGTILGFLFGDVGSGILLGAVLQLIFITGLPIGRDIPPDGQAGGFIGCATFFIIRTLHPVGQALTIALLLALIGSIFGGTLEIITRRFNEHLIRAYRKKHTSLYLYHFLGLITAFLRGICLFTPFLILVYFVRLSPDFPGLTISSFLIMGTGIGLANALYLFLKKSTIVYVITGGVCGLALLVL